MLITMASSVIISVVLASEFLVEEPGEMRLNGEPWLQRVERGIDRDVGRVALQLFAPDQSGRDALLDDHLEEATKNRYPVPFANAGQARMVGELLAQIVSQVPTQTEPVGDHPHELALRAQPLEEEDELEFKEDDRINGWTTTIGIGVAHHIADEGEVEHALEMAIEVTLGHQPL